VSEVAKLTERTPEEVFMDGVLELRRSRHAFLKETVTLFFCSYLKAGVVFIPGLGPKRKFGVCSSDSE